MFCLGTVFDKELARGDCAAVAVVSAPLHPELCRYWSGCEPWGHFGCLKAGAGCLLSVTHMDCGEGGQTCSSMLWISPVLALLLSFSCRFLWQTLGSCVLLILSACIPPTSVQTFACKTEFLKKPGILPAMCWLPYSLLFIVQGNLRVGHFCTMSWHFLSSTLPAAEVRNRPDMKTTGLGAKTRI